MGGGVGGGGGKHCGVFFPLFLYRFNTRHHLGGAGFPQLQIYEFVLIMFRAFFPLPVLRE